MKTDQLTPDEVRRLRVLLRRVWDDEIVDQYSESPTEDGRLLRLFNLRCGGTGAQCFKPGESPGPVWRTD